MAADGTIKAIIAKLAERAIADLAGDGLKTAYPRIPDRIDGKYPCLLFYRLGQGSSFAQMTAAGRQASGALVAGSRSRIHHVGATLLVGPRPGNASQLGVLEEAVRDWIDRLDTYYYQHFTVANLALLCLAVSSKPIVITLNDMAHFGEEFHLQIETRPRVAPHA